METLEAAIALYIVRFGLVLVALGVSVANWIRTSRLQHLRLSLPTDLTANVDRLRHEVASSSESLRAHTAKEDMREVRAAKKEAKEAAEAPQEISAGVQTASVPPTAPHLSPAQLKFALNRAASIANDQRRGRRSA